MFNIISSYSLIDKGGGGSNILCNRSLFFKFPKFCIFHLCNSTVQLPCTLILTLFCFDSKLLNNQCQNYTYLKLQPITLLQFPTKTDANACAKNITITMFCFGEKTCFTTHLIILNLFFPIIFNRHNSM